MLNDTVDGKEIYNTIRRKTKDAFYKNIVKKGYLLKKSKYRTELCVKNNFEFSRRERLCTLTSSLYGKELH